MLVTFGVPGRIVCSRCGQDKPARAFYRIYNPHYDERAQPCAACCRERLSALGGDPPPEPDPAARAVEAAQAAAPLVAQALALCDDAGLEKAAKSLADALAALTDPDDEGPAALGGQVPRPGGEAGRPPPPPSSRCPDDDRREDASPPPFPGGRS